jgi:foldase protein PrsA
MKALKSVLALGAFFVASIALAACGSGVPGNSVADMAGNPITTQAFNHWMYIAAKGQASQSPGQPVIVPTDPPNFTQCVSNVRKQIPSLASMPSSTLKKDCSQLFTSLSNQVMEFLIRAYWYQAEAARLHVTVTGAQVQQAFTAAKQQQFPTEAGFQSFLSQSGQTLQDILFRFRVNQIYMKLIAKHNTTITTAQVQAYYNSHLSQFGTPEKRDVRVVLTKTQGQANAAKGALAGGQSWGAVAKKYSIDPTTKNKGGQLTGVSKGQQDQALDAAVFSAPLKKLSGPVHGQFGYYVFQVTKITTGRQQTLAQAAPLIRQTLTSQRQSNAQNAVDSQARQHWLAKTKCRKDYAMADCSGYKAPSTSSAPGARTTTTR